MDEETKIFERLARIEQDSKSTHRRLDNLERLTESVHIIATEIKAMREDVNDITGRVDEIENRDGEMWRRIVGYAATTIVGLILGALAARFGL